MLSLQNIPYVYDIVLSDFGREATIRLLTELVNGERTRIQQLLEANGGPREAPFFDEYRRIMFACVGDVAYISKIFCRKGGWQNPPFGLVSVIWSAGNSCL